MRRIHLFFVFIVALTGVGLAGCARELQSPSGATERDVISLTGTIQFISLEGGFFAIRGDDGTTYDPLNLQRDYQQNGLRVRLKARLRNDVATVRMAGPVIEILEIEKM